MKTRFMDKGDILLTVFHVLKGTLAEQMFWVSLASSMRNVSTFLSEASGSHFASTDWKPFSMGKQGT